MPSAERAAAIVLAGGESRRFGSDKLAYAVDARSLLDHTLSGLADDLDVYLVGPARTTIRPVIMIREDPPGGGPTAGLIAGLRAALADHVSFVTVLPGDAPAAGPAAMIMLDRLRADPACSAVIGIDPQGYPQPLQLALRRDRAAELITLAGVSAGAGQSARRLVDQLQPAATPFALTAAAAYDIDDHDQLAHWLARPPTSHP